MEITIFGAGYVGLVTGACFSELGHRVHTVDIDQKRIGELNGGKVPIYEPGLFEIFQKNIAAKRLFFTTDAKKAIECSEILFIAVGTPQAPDGSSDLRAVFSVAKTIAQNMERYKLIVIKSTVPVGTNVEVRKILKANCGKATFDLASNPEFLREGSAIHDFMVPDRILVGTDTEKARKTMAELYEALSRTNIPLVFTSIASAELIKYAANAMLAARISFMNQLAPLCEETGADIKEVARGIGLDSRIGPRFLQAGIGYGGSCFPKDVLSLAHTLKKHKLGSDLIDAVHNINERQKVCLLPKIKKTLGPLKGKTIALWGLSFKPKTDDLREAPSLALIESLEKEGVKIRVYDPVSMTKAKELGVAPYYAKDMYDCVQNADCLILVTEWDEFRAPDWKKVAASMKKQVIIDGRNIYDPDKIKSVGFSYQGVGR